MNKVLKVARIQLLNAPMVYGMGPLILILALLCNVAIFAAVGPTGEPGGHTTGGLVTIYVVMLAVHIQTMTQVLPFAMSLSVTRRTFWQANSLVVLGQAITYGMLVYVLRLVEIVTDGWGLRLHYFDLPFLTTGNAATQLLVYIVPFLLTGFLGIWVGVVFKRWGQLGIWAVAIGSAALFTAAAVMVTLQRWWPAVGSFFADQSAVALLTGYPVVLAAFFAGLAYLTLRRATP